MTNILYSKPRNWHWSIIGAVATVIITYAIYIGIAYFVITSVLDVRQTLHDIHTELQEINNG